MDQKDEKYLILEQYRIYSESKDRFIERQFSTNRFYLILNTLFLRIQTELLSRQLDMKSRLLQQKMILQSESLTAERALS